MKAAVLKKPYQIVVEQLPGPTPEPDQVVIEVAHCGVCGSDIRYFKGENPWALHTLGRNAPNPPNIILGHEFSGRIVEAGSEKFSHLVGQDVAIIPYDICGRCPDCLAGNHHLCQNMIHIGHGAVINCRKIGNNVLIGMNSTILHEVEIGSKCIIGAGCLVSQGMKVPDNSFVAGVPGVVKGPVTKNQSWWVEKAPFFYAKLGKRYKEGNL